MSMKEQIDRIRVEIEDARMRAGTGDRVTLVGVTKDPSVGSGQRCA